MPNSEVEHEISKSSEKREAPKAALWSFKLEEDNQTTTTTLRNHKKLVEKNLFKLLSSNGYSTHVPGDSTMTADVAINTIQQALRELRFCIVDDDSVFNQLVNVHSGSLPKEVNRCKIPDICNALAASGTLTLNLSRLRNDWGEAYRQEMSRNLNEVPRIRGSAAALLLHIHKSLNVTVDKVSVDTATTILSRAAAEPDIVQESEFVEAVDILVRRTSTAVKPRPEYTMDSLT